MPLRCMHTHGHFRSISPVCVALRSCHGFNTVLGQTNLLSASLLRVRARHCTPCSRCQTRYSSAANAANRATGGNITMATRTIISFVCMPRNSLPRRSSSLLPTSRSFNTRSNRSTSDDLKLPPSLWSAQSFTRDCRDEKELWQVAEDATAAREECGWFWSSEPTWLDSWRSTRDCREECDKREKEPRELAELLAAALVLRLRLDCGPCAP